MRPPADAPLHHSVCLPSICRELQKGDSPHHCVLPWLLPAVLLFLFFPTSHHLPLTPLTSSTHSHEYLKANTGMENMQQGEKKEMFILRP